MIAASSSEIVFCERTSILSRNRLIIFWGMLHILPLAGPTAEVPHPSFMVLRPQPPFHSGFWDSAVSLFTLGTGLLQPCLPEAATNTICVSVGQKISQCWALSHPRRLCPCQRALACSPACGGTTGCCSGCDTVKDIRLVSPRSCTTFTASGSCWVLTGAEVLQTSNNRTLPVEQDFASRVFFSCDVP